MPSVRTMSLVARGTQEGTEMSTTYIVGIAIVGVIIVGVVVWLVIRQMRQRKRATMVKQVERPVSIQIPVHTPKSASTRNSRRSMPISPLASHDPFAAESILAPPPALVAPRSRAEIVEYHRQSGNFPKPFSFALNGGSPGSSPRSSARLSSGLVPPPSLASPNSDGSRPISWVRHSFMSMGKRASSGRYSVMSTSSSFFGSEPTTGTARKVRQLFSPVLPDELLLTALGEQLTVIQTFDDGWCVVGRENAHAELAQQKKSLFGKGGSVSSASEAGVGAGVELGVVPSWCFLKPVKGLKAERPVRSTSLGITVQMDGGGPTRDNLISWSNF